MLKSILVNDAVGMILGHDITRIVPGEFKGRAFKKGHILTEEDIPLLLDIGKEHIFVLELHPGNVHEDEAAQRIARAAAGQGIMLSDPVEGRVNLTAADTGLLCIDVESLNELNGLGGIVMATRHSGHVFKADTAVAGTRIIPLIMEKEQIEKAEALCREVFPLIEIKPLASRRVGIVTTGSEVFHGRIKDAFGPVIRKKFKAWDCPVIGQTFVSDDLDMTVNAIQEMIAEGAEMVVVTGGMSVDPDDQTPASIRAAGGEVTVYGAPTFPGAMFMLAYIGDVPVMGLPGCVMYHDATIFELVVPRLLAGETVSRDFITRLGHGGYCAGCRPCRYPDCSFGKG